MKKKKQEQCRGCHHEAIIKELIAMNRALNTRLPVVETALLKRKQIQANTEETQPPAALEDQPKPKRRMKAATNLSTTWYEWYTRMPRVWDSSDRHKKSESRHVVAFMKLFLDGSFILDDT
ncbi:hypothetical protein PF010_g4806 [Phytophthora fragariae]|uniref:Uncharacterized protein n=2 Tax=Phytophthora fragariae TaxID=53985 RepID=A0A6A4A6V5_9STRA|nr:hypothetical protein PF003_g7256 [Phytophthora fragariae]KAE8922574.1 hypothetical protein PF009_g27164 [Phytophthora fragariae]KAE9127250.1 hypothetical protein PF007_g5686 [Phytophthora fragariae]KAE9127650.1 hypothetical protein PF010_g4806 [Phytophthora fragariae]KAE9178895.1 hypothetical protein PF004_g25338 [Phytophthora fragariae]